MKTNFAFRAFALSALGLCAFFLCSGNLRAQQNHSEDQRFTPGTWEFGPFFNGGVGVGDRSDYTFVWAGVQAGRTLTGTIRAGILSGSFEYGAEISPFFQSYTPAPHTVIRNTPNGPEAVQYGGGTFTGGTVAPVILRWNLATRSKRIKPWIQAKGAVLYTSHKYPPDIIVQHGTPGGTSVWNFMPQGGVGFHYFLSHSRSIDLGINAVHISSASLGDKNPGVNASMQFQIGYTFWK